jgi:hypothetical protein
MDPTARVVQTKEWWYWDCSKLTDHQGLNTCKCKCNQTKTKWRTTNPEMGRTDFDGVDINSIQNREVSRVSQGLVHSKIELVEWRCRPTNAASNNTACSDNEHLYFEITRLTKRIVEANELVVFGNTYLARSVPFVQTSSKANQAQGSVMQEAPSTAMQASMGYKVCRIRANNSCWVLDSGL